MCAHTCDHRFTHPRRPRDLCQLPVSDPTVSSACVWHDPRQRPPNFPLESELVNLIADPRHWLEGAVLARENLARLRLDGAGLPHSDLEDTALNGVWLIDACLDSADLTLAHLDGANLRNATLVNARLTRCTMRGADLRRANLTAADCEGSNLVGAYLSDIQIDTSSRLTKATWAPINKQRRGSWAANPGELEIGDLPSAARLFASLSQYMSHKGLYEESRQFYASQMTALHLHAIGADKKSVNKLDSLKIRALLRVWLGPSVPHLVWGLHRFVWGYGIKPRNVILTLIQFILVGSFILWATGVTVGNTETHSLTYSFITSLMITSGFSSTTYGPAGPFGVVIGSILALVGIILMSAFIVSLAVKYVHHG